MEIFAYNTHYKITDYELGYSDRLEKLLSVYLENRYEYEPKYFYNKEDKILYVPRGVDEGLLISILEKPINYMGDTYKPKRISFGMIKPPRNDVQKESIRFLAGKEEYSYMSKVNQAVLSLPGGGGKTYSAIAAMSLYGVKSMVVTHTVSIRDQWKERFLEYTNVPEKSLCVLSGTGALLDILENKSRKSVNDAICYLVVHRTINLFINEYGFDKFNQVMIKLGIGLKIIDEAHKEFSNTLLMDYASNVWKTFYLTATFKRSLADDKLFQLSFNRVYKLYKNTEQMKQIRNVYYIIDEFQSTISPVEVAGMYNRKNFSAYKYIDLEIEHGYLLDHVVKWLKWFYVDKKEDGKTYIISPKKSSCEIMYKLVKQFFPQLKSCVHNSDNRIENLEDYDVICATFKMVGTGDDLDDLRMIINLEPIGSDANNDQLVHRLMRGKDSRNAYFIEPIDKRVDNVVRMMYRRRKLFKKFVKHIISVKE